MSRDSYIVMIVRRKAEFVAIDSNGSKRAWGNVDGCKGRSPRDLAEYLFHAVEIESVTPGVGDVLAVVKIIAGPPTENVVAETIASAAHVLNRDVVAVLNRHRSIACETNPLLAHCLERVIGDLRRSMDELNQIAILSKAHECEAV